MSRSAAVILVALAAAAPVAAHHGAGTFDLRSTVSFTGATLTRVEFINPHSWLYFEVTDENGRVSQHRCEMRSAHVLRRSGWSADMFPSGTRIDLTASPDRADPNSCYLQTILFENGSRMDRYGQYVKAPDGGIKEVRGPIRTVNTKREPRRPTGEPNISGEWAPEQLVMADPRGVGGGLVPLSTIAELEPGERPARAGGGGRQGGGGGRGGRGRQFGGAELTEAGEKAMESLDREDQPRFRCETTSIIFDWTFDGPVNRITQNKETIIIQYGQMGLERTVYMTLKQHPANLVPTRAGHSIGRWEGDVLVVDTVGFLPGVLTGSLPHSDKLHVVERFSLDPQTMRLRRDYIAEDPVYLNGQYRGSDVVQVADAPYEPGRCRELGFINYAEQVKQQGQGR